MTPVVSTVCAGVGRRAQERVERAGRAGEEQDLCLRRRDREDQQLRLVERDLRAPPSGRAAPPGRPEPAGGGGSIAPMIWTSCSRSGSLMLSGLMPGDDRDGAVGQHLDDREGVAAKADDQVEGVADVEQVADTGELVDRDRERAPARRDAERHERGSGSRCCGPGCWSKSAVRVVLPIAWVTEPRTFRSRTSTGSVCSLTISAVMTVPSGMSTAATTVGRFTGGALALGVRTAPARARADEQHDDERQCRKEDAEQKDEPTGPSHELNPPRCKAAACDRWHHSSIGLVPGDYTNGLVPVARLGKIARVVQGPPQGAGNDRRPVRVDGSSEGPVLVQVGRRNDCSGGPALRLGRKS